MKIEGNGKEERVRFFQDLYQEALGQAENSRLALQKWMEQYKGSKQIDGSPVDAKVVRNITYEFVEAQISTYIPSPKVEPKMVSERNLRNAKAIETMLNTNRDRLPFESLNDIDERYNPIYGGSVWLVEWDETITTHNTSGDVRVSCLPPHRFVGQPNIYAIEDMEYLFILFETTKEDILRKYDVDVSILDDLESEDNTDDKTATLYVCYYKDDKDKVCQYIWSGDQEIQWIEDYYNRKKKICVKCGKPERLCTCEMPYFEIQDEEFEELDHDIVRTDGSVLPRLSPVMEDGQVVMETQQVPMTNPDGSTAIDLINGVALPMMVDVQVPKTEPTRIPWYQITAFPVVIRKNTSQEESLLGQSDCEYIRDQQQEINKIESRILEKILKSGVFPIVPDDFVDQLDDSLYERVFRARPNNFNLFAKLDLQAQIGQDVEQSERVYEHAKRILGITDSYRGLSDSTAQSGVAKQVQVQQSSGRLQSKRVMKNFAYSEIDRIIFQYYLAYADEPRPAAYRDAEGNLQNCIFNRYDFIERDENGEYYYADDYTFSCSSNPEEELDRAWLWQQNKENFQAGAYGDPALPQTKLIYWQNMEKAHYPYARDNVERIRTEIARLNEMAQLQNQIAGLQEEVNSRKAYEQYVQDTLRGGNANA